VRRKGQSRVGHIKSRRERPDLTLSLENLRVLCAGCDDARKQSKQREKGNPHAVRVPAASDALSAAWR